MTAARRSIGHARAHSTIDRGFAAAFAAGLAWAPFWLGGAWRLPWGVNALLFPGLTLSYELTRAALRRSPSLPIREIAAPVALFLLALIWIVFQMPPLGVAPLIPQLGERTPASISVDPGATAIALTRLLTDACAFWLAAQLGADCKISRRLLQAVVAIAVLYSVDGLWLAATCDNAIPGFAPPDGGGEVRSTFVNRNSFATFASLGFVTTLALATQADRAAPSTGRAVGWLDAIGQRGVFLGAGLIVLAALLGSASRGGVLSAVVGVLTLFALRAERRRRRRQSWAGILIVALLILLVSLAFGAPIVIRLATLGLFDAERLAVYRITLEAVSARPFVGYGYGAFSETFPLFRDANLSPNGVWEMAHNAYLELALGTGVACASAIMLALALLAARCLQGALQRNGDCEAPLAAASASALVGVNSLIDYSVQIEAVTLTFMTLLGLGLAQSRVAMSRRRAPC